MSVLAYIHYSIYVLKCLNIQIPTHFREMRVLVLKDSLPLSTSLVFASVFNTLTS